MLSRAILELEAKKKKKKNSDTDPIFISSFNLFIMAFFGVNFDFLFEYFIKFYLS